MKTADLIGPALDYAVAVALGLPLGDYVEADDLYGPLHCGPEYSTDWKYGGPLIEREWITLNYGDPDLCTAYYLRTLFDDEEGWIQFGPTPLVAAMRCFVASKLGDEVEIPEELK